MSQQNLMTRLTHLELLSPSQSETKEKLPFSGFYGNSAQDHFFLAIYGSLDSAMSLMRESFRIEPVSCSGREHSDGAQGRVEVNELAPQTKLFYILENVFICFLNKSQMRKMSAH